MTDFSLCRVSSGTWHCPAETAGKWSIVSSQLSNIDDSVITLVIEITKRGFEHITTPFIETPSGTILFSPGSVDVDSPTGSFTNSLFAHFHQSTPDPMALMIGVHCDPVKIVTVDCAGDRSETGISNQTPTRLQKHELIAGCRSFGESFFNELHGHVNFRWMEETRRRDKFTNGLTIIRRDFGTNTQLSRKHHRPDSFLLIQSLGTSAS
jgi:hypothetical protein